MGGKMSKEYYTTYYQANKEKFRESTRLWKKNNPEKEKSSARKTNLKRYYNITPEIYDTMFEKQKGCCGVCKKHQTEFKQRLAVDHCHKTGKVRKLLCSECNTSLGHYEKYKSQFEVYLKECDNG